MLHHRASCNTVTPFLHVASSCVHSTSSFSSGAARVARGGYRQVRLEIRSFAGCDQGRQRLLWEGVIGTS
ncbi:hypothetical protein IQ06DRAFT_294891 [Phaeosphaeriaceae sp. SRC1lsM3a]|nr:hypothetical protein IQ06DRAFT_294891 [Stagonospora sp. SRC1lsM3a]